MNLEMTYDDQLWYSRAESRKLSAASLNEIHYDEMLNDATAHSNTQMELFSYFQIISDAFH